MSQSDGYQGTSQAVLFYSSKKAIQLAVKVFESEGYETLIREAREPCSIDEMSPPAVILVDSVAESDDPLALCREIRLAPGCDYVPLILLSDENDQDSLHRAYDAQVTTVFFETAGREGVSQARAIARR